MPPHSAHLPGPPPRKLRGLPEVAREGLASCSLLLLVFSSLPQYGFAGVLLKAFWVWGCRVRVEGLDLGLWGFISRGSDHRPQGLRVESYNVHFRP